MQIYDHVTHVLMQKTNTISV